MKKTFFAAAMVSFAACANAGTEPAYIYANAHAVTGDIVPTKNVLNYFYIKRPCKLPLVNASHMRAFYWKSAGINRYGCWHDSLGDKRSIIFEDGAVDSMPVFATPAAIVFDDGSAQITEKDYDSRTAARKYVEQIPRRPITRGEYQP